jgi:hypothetical protein
MFPLDHLNDVCFPPQIPRFENRQKAKGRSGTESAQKSFHSTTRFDILQPK